jgi:hypothetical protein
LTNVSFRKISRIDDRQGMPSREEGILVAIMPARRNHDMTGFGPLHDRVLVRRVEADGHAFRDMD